MGGGAQGQQGGVVAGCVGGAQVQGYRLAQAAYAVFQVVRHHALELGLRALRGRRGLGQSQAARGQQTNRQRQGLVVGEHHGRQLEAGDQAVAAVAAALGDDGNAQVFQLGDVAAQGSAVDLQPPRQFGAAHAPMGLQQFQDGQYTGGRGIHGEKSSALLGPK
jgi:hypothetical protein